MTDKTKTTTFTVTPTNGVDFGLLTVQTTDLRVLRRGGDRVLQQKWQAMDGSVEWRDVLEVEA